ncbi:MAG: aminoacyl-tRNA hydrolase, partial [Flavobacteriaceae bacterium]|nr:aminoacyl-tRNA hydrolase [Flavobacteriaceae bacterium]
KAIRSSGAGGQHVNKVSSKVELTFDIENSSALSAEQKQVLINKLSSRLTKDHVLILYCDESRSQHKNKELVTERCIKLIKQSLRTPKKRKATRPTKSSIQKRLKFKKRISIKKENRKSPDLE